jgi:hypothetical protein
MKKNSRTSYPDWILLCMGLKDSRCKTDLAGLGGVGLIFSLTLMQSKDQFFCKLFKQITRNKIPKRVLLVGIDSG